MLHYHYKRYFFLLFLSLFIMACTPNKAYHSNSSQQDSSNRLAGIQKNSDYDLTFVEFTDRGNVFDRNQLENVLQHIDHYAKQQNGVSVITYVHGWNHNSAPDNENLESFRQLLKIAAKHKLSRKRKLVGVYIGWRGESLTIPTVKHLTYWSRKRVAQDIGNGGITELLLRLEKSLYKNQSPTKNVLINTGHSMGGAILLSALNDILMSRLLDTEVDKQTGCVKSLSFGHSTLLVNPAIEANEIFQLEEIVKRNNCYAESQDILLHMISSEADIANKIAFKVGQWLGVSLRRNEVNLSREYHGKPLVISERNLDTITIANFPAFHTGKSRARAKVKDKNICASKNSDRAECYIICSKDDHSCVDPKYRNKHIPVAPNEPISFVYTDSKFMKGHTDIFQPKIAGYIAAITEETQYKRFRTLGKSAVQIRQLIHPRCLGENGGFDFAGCFDTFKEVFRIEQEK